MDERFDQALERARSDPDDLPHDPELRSLVQLALRLERELPADLPDPAFRLRLGEDLRSGASVAAEPQPAGPRTTRRWRMFYDWRYAVAATSLVIMVTVGLLAGRGIRESTRETSPALPTLVTAMGADPKSDTPNRAESTRTVVDTQVLPPIDAAHVVQPPVGRSASSESTAASPTPSRLATPPGAGITLATSLPGLLPSARTYLLSSPAPPLIFVENVVARLGATAEIEVTGQGDFEIVRAIDQSRTPIVQWNTREAYFVYERGTRQPTPPPSRAEVDPRETARHWLEEIGYDLTTIRYTAVLEESGHTGPYLVRFTPIDLPPSTPQASIGILVGVAPGGAIEFANGFWFSLVESAEAPLRTSEEAWQAVRAGDGYSFEIGQVPPSTSQQIESVRLTHLLTRADDRNYVLQPVVEFSGPTWTSSGPIRDQVYVSAVRK